MEKFYTLKEVAGITGFALRTLEREARAEKFSHIRRGRVRIMTEDQIAELIKNSKVGPGNSDDPAAKDAAIKKLLNLR